MPGREYDALVRMLRETPLPRPIPELRAAYDAMGTELPPVDEADVRDASLGGRPCRWFHPRGMAAPAAAILYLHGGGYGAGSIASHSHMGARMAARTGAAVALLDFRLAPEHPYPAAIDDAVAAYAELLATFAPGRVAIAGDSAGGGLAVALIARLAADGLPQPGCAYCMSPWVDLTLSSEYHCIKLTQDPVANPEQMAEMAGFYLGGADARTPFASPLFANLSAAPPMMIHVGSAEVLLGDALRLAAALGRADREVRLEIWPQMIHVWPWFFPILPEGAAALDAGCAFIRAHQASVPSASLL